MTSAPQELLEPADVEAAAVTYLRPLFPDHTVSTRRPYDADWTTAPDRIIRVTVAGGAGPRDLVLDAARLLFEVWDADGPTAADTAARLAAQLGVWRGQHGPAYVYACRPLRPVNAPDPLTRNARYTLLAELTTRMGARST